MSAANERAWILSDKISGSKRSGELLVLSAISDIIQVVFRQLFFLENHPMRCFFRFGSIHHNPDWRKNGKKLLLFGKYYLGSACFYQNFWMFFDQSFLLSCRRKLSQLCCISCLLLEHLFIFASIIEAFEKLSFSRCFKIVEISLRWLLWRLKMDQNNELLWFFRISLISTSTI